MSETTGKRSRRRKAPPNTEWRGDTLYGRVRIKGKLARWSLRTGDVDVAKGRVEEDIAQMKAAAYYGDNRVKYRDIEESWARNHILHQVGPRTAHRYACSLRVLDPLLPQFLDEINKSKIAEIVDKRRAAGVTNATIRRDLTALSSVLEYAEVEDNPALARLKKLKERRDPIVLPIDADIEAVIARASPMFGALIRGAWLTGCRQEELVQSQRSRLDHTRRQLTVVGKRNKLRVIDLEFGGAYDLIRALPAHIGCKWIFWHRSPIVEDGRTAGHEGVPYASAHKLFHELVKDEEKRAKKEGREFHPLRFHDLRHRHAVDWLKSGRSIYDLQQRLGHSSVKTTEIYLKYLTPEEKRAAMYGIPLAQAESQKESQV